MIKKLIFSLVLLLPLSIYAQTPQAFTVKGKVGHLNAPARAYLYYQLGANKVLDSAAIVNGSFELTGSVLFPVNAGIVIDHQGVGIAKLANQSSPSIQPDVYSFYLEKGVLNVTSATDSIKKAEITGSPINEDNKALMSQLIPVTEKIQKLYAEAQSAAPAQQQSVEFQNTTQSRFKLLQKEEEGVLEVFIKAHPNSYLSLLALSQLGGPSADPMVLEPLYNSLSPSLKIMEPAKQLHASIEALKVTAVGSMAPDFTQNDVNGAPVKLSSFRGKYVLLDFWASWCPPCRQENPNIVKVYNKYKAKNFTILGVSLDKPGARQAWMQAIKSDNLSWTQVSDLKYWDNAAAALYFVSGIPQNFLIDPNGKIVAKNLRGGDLDDKLAELLGKI